MNLYSIKKQRLLATAVFFFSFIRSAVFATGDLVGYDFYKKESTFNTTSAVFFTLIFLYSLLSAMLVSSLQKKCTSKFWLPCLLLITDPILLINQRHLVILLIHVLCFLYLNAQFSEKRVFADCVQIFFLLVSALISPEVTFGYIPIIFLIEMLPGIIDNTKKSCKSTIIIRLLSVFVFAVGFAGNKLIYSNVPAFKAIIDFLNQTQFSEMALITDVLLLSVPYIFAGGYFFYVFFKLYKRNAKINKKIQKKKNINKTDALLNIVILSFILFFIGCIFGGYKTISTVSLILPVIILLLLFEEDDISKQTLLQINNSILMHPTISIALFMSMYYFCLRFYLERFGGTTMIGSYFTWVNK